MEIGNKNATITYAALTVALRLLASQLAVFNLWYQRRAYERSRGELITMLYEKTLNRKILGTKQEKQEEDMNGSATNGNGTNGNGTNENGTNGNGTNGHTTNENATNGNATNGHATNGLATNGHATNDHATNGCATNGNGSHLNADNATEVPLKAKPQNLVARLLILLRSPFSRKHKTEDKEEKVAASMGKVLNLMRNDVYEVAQRFWDFSDVIVQPIGAIFATLLIWRMLGWACLLGVVALAASQLVNIAIARFQVYFEKKRRVATDEKLQKTSQFIESIRHLRWYGWQKPWMESILESRRKELHLRIIQIILSTSLAFMLRFGSGLFPAVAFYAFTVWEGKPLRVDLIFPAIDLFNLLEGYLRALPQLVTTLLNAYVAMGRIEEFMAEPDKELADVVPEGSAGLSLDSVSFAWPGVEQNVLHNVTVAFYRRYWEN
jgi:ABC-type multidrug transport system fused ATPase/permease subunit